MVPSLHKKFLSLMVDKVFCMCALRFMEKLEPFALTGDAVNMEEKFSQLTLDVIGLSLFNYNFDSLTSDSPVIDAVYTALKEAEARSTDILPYWQVGSFGIQCEMCLFHCQVEIFYFAALDISCAIESVRNFSM